MTHIVVRPQWPDSAANEALCWHAQMLTPLHLDMNGNGSPPRGCGALLFILTGCSVTLSAISCPQLVIFAEMRRQDSRRSSSGSRNIDSLHRESGSTRGQTPCAIRLRAHAVKPLQTGSETPLQAIQLLFHVQASSLPAGRRRLRQPPAGRHLAVRVTGRRSAAQTAGTLSPDCRAGACVITFAWPCRRAYAKSLHICATVRACRSRGIKRSACVQVRLKHKTALLRTRLELLP